MDYENSKIPTFKVIMLGNSTVGKTSILSQLCSNVFDSEPKATIGGSFIEKNMETSKGTIKFHLWDTAGQEQYRCIVPIYSRDSNAAVIVFDVSNPKTFQTADEWLDLVNRNRSSDCSIFVVVNKMDLEHELDLKIVESWANEHNAKFFTASAKDGESIKKVFNFIAETLVTSSFSPGKPQIHIEEKKANNSSCC